MKIYLFYSMILLSFAGCKTTKKVEQAHRDDSSLKTARELGIQQQRAAGASQDSGAVQWQFWSDRPFHYHPDSGLRASAGLLTLSEMYARNRYAVQDSTSVNQRMTDSVQRRVMSTQSVENTYSPNWSVWLLVVGVLWLILRAGKVFR